MRQYGVALSASPTADEGQSDRYTQKILLRAWRARDPCTAKDKADRIHERAGADINLADGIAFGACRLPNDAGLVFKVLGRETAQVKAKVREFWSVVRQEIIGAALPPPYLWR